MLNRNFVLWLVTIVVMFANTLVSAEIIDTAIEHTGTIVVKNGADFHKHRLCAVFLNTNGLVSGVNFSNADLRYARLASDGEEIDPVSQYKECNFHKANMTFAYGIYAEFIDCDFTDANIDGAEIALSPKNLAQTRNYKLRDLRGVKLNCSWVIYESTINIVPIGAPSFDFSNCLLNDATLPYGIGNCKFDDAMLEGTEFYALCEKKVESHSFRVEQLYSTKSYKQGTIINCNFSVLDFTNANFTNINLTQCQFYGNLKDAKFDNAIISNCTLRDAKNLTLAQIKSTWNYKYNRMDGIELPKDIQDKLDKEKKK
ncbi:MAG: pentapeptide repeat-containing protein [Planctomycetaceae bacterium]|jgi:uncharacterized protein YjbI with pentapeptide repeats|nr:pentapeptide repeat-containing protein [Planctomycetaceae bacterium]